MKNKKTRALIIVLIVLTIASTSLLGVIWQREGYTRKVMLKLGLTTQKDTTKDEYALLSWQSCLDSLDYQADVAFFGDSITRGNRWQDYFQEIKVCNLGYSGDTVDGLVRRMDMVTAVHPQKVFILIGVNNMGKGRYLETLTQGYEKLIAGLRADNPQSQLYIISILPTRAPSKVSNQQIVTANQALEQLAARLDVPYIDAHASFVGPDGQMIEAYSGDGVHLSGQGKDQLAACLAPYVRQTGA